MTIGLTGNMWIMAGMYKRTIRKIGFALILLLLTSSVLAANTNKPFLWRVTSDSATVYLLGSLHAATIDMYPLPQPLYDAFDKSSYLVVELDIGKIDPQEQLALTQQYGIYTDGSALDQHISKDAWKKLDSYLQERGLPNLLFKSMKPWLANLTITIGEFTRLGYDTNLGIDQHFLNRAKGKPILELETLEQQMKVLSSASDKQQETDLVVTLDNIDNINESVQLMRKYWEQGDAEKLYEAMRQDSEKFPGYEKQWEALLDKRNIKMAKKINSYLKGDATYFVIVGALHLGGKKGLINLLDKKHAVEQVLN